MTTQPMTPSVLERAPAESASRPGPESLSILFLVDQLTELGGGERALFTLATKLAQRGYRTVVVTFREHPSPEAYQLFPELIVLPVRSCFSLHAMQVAWQIRGLIRREAIDIAHTWFESADLFGAAAARLGGVRVVISSRRDMGFLRRRQHTMAYRVLNRLHTRVIAVSQQVREWHQRQDHLRVDQMATIYNGIDLEAFDRLAGRGTSRLALGIPEEALIVTTVANLKPWKGVDVVLDAAALVHARHPAAVFLIAGDWTDLNYLAALRVQAHRLGLERQVHFLGRVKEISSLLCASDVFVLLSRSEGFPNVVLEAMAASLPVVATAVGGTPEAMVDGSTGYLVANEDHELAGERINALLSDATLRLELGRAGRRHVESCFSLEQMISKHSEVYRDLAATHA